jgi:hypothetical protein
MSAGSVDRTGGPPRRLRLAAQISAILADDSKAYSVDFVTERKSGRSPGCGPECCGHQGDSGETIRRHRKPVQAPSRVGIGDSCRDRGERPHGAGRRGRPGGSRHVPVGHGWAWPSWGVNAPQTALLAVTPDGSRRTPTVRADASSPSPTPAARWRSSGRTTHPRARPRGRPASTRRRTAAKLAALIGARRPGRPAPRAPRAPRRSRRVSGPPGDEQVVGRLPARPAGEVPRQRPRVLVVQRGQVVRLVEAVRLRTAPMRRRGALGFARLLIARSAAARSRAAHGIRARKSRRCSATWSVPPTRSGARDRTSPVPTSGQAGRSTQAGSPLATKAAQYRFIRSASSRCAVDGAGPPDRRTGTSARWSAWRRSGIPGEARSPGRPGRRSRRTKCRCARRRPGRAPRPGAPRRDPCRSAPVTANALCRIARWNSSADPGDTRCTATVRAPYDTPTRVTFAGSSPNRAISRCTQRSAACWSCRPKVPPSGRPG